MFRILSITIHEHPLLRGMTFELTNPEELETSNYYSVIIGPNGTGKSYLLNAIIVAFNEIALLKGSTTYKPKLKFTIRYRLGDVEYLVSTENQNVCLN